MTEPREVLLAILQAMRELLALPGNDFVWSSWKGSDHALAEWDGLIAAVHRGEFPREQLELLFLPTGDLQEVSMSSGWTQQYLELASKVDDAVVRLAGHL